MFDASLTKEHALADVSAPGSVSACIALEPDEIAQYRQMNELRNICFSSEEHCRRYLPVLKESLMKFARRFVDSKLGEFLLKNAHTYLNVGLLQQHYKMQIMTLAGTFLTELIPNAVMRSDDVNVSMCVSRKGIFADIEEHGSSEDFDVSFLAKLSKTAADICSQLSCGESIENVMLETKRLWRKAIGYVPVDIPKELVDVPYRGNGMANILVNDFFRVIFLKDGEKHTLLLHTAQQLEHLHKMHQGDRSFVEHVYGLRSFATSSTEKNEDSHIGAIDAVFSQFKF